MEKQSNMHYMSQIQLLMWPTNPACTAVLEVTLCHHLGAPELCLFCHPAWLSPIMSHVRSHTLCSIVLPTTHQQLIANTTNQ